MLENRKSVLIKKKKKQSHVYIVFVSFKVRIGWLIDFLDWIPQYFIIFTSKLKFLGEGPSVVGEFFMDWIHLKLLFGFPFYACNSDGPPVILNGPRTRTRTKLVPCPRETFSQVFIKDSSPSSPPLSYRKWRIFESILAVNQNPQLMQ